MPGPEPGGRRQVRQRPAAVRGELRIRHSKGIRRQKTVRNRYIRMYSYYLEEGASVKVTYSDEVVKSDRDRWIQKKIRKRFGEKRGTDSSRRQKRIRK